MTNCHDKVNISTPFSPSSNLQTDLAKPTHENNFESTLAYIHNHTYVHILHTHLDKHTKL